MRVLEATDFYYPWIAGPAPFIRNLSSGLVDRGHDVVIVCPSTTGSPYDEHGRPPAHRVRTWAVPFGYNLRSGLPYFDARRFVRAWRPDVVHIHHPFPISSIALVVARSEGIPVVATNHTVPSCTLFGLQNTMLYGPVSSVFGAYLKALLGKCSIVTTPTATAAAMLHDIGYRGSIRPVSNGVDTTRFRPLDSVAPRSGDVPTVLYTGRLDDDKDMDTVIDAIPHVLEKQPARFRIGGEGTDRARLEAKVAGMGLSHAVEFTGYVSDIDLPHVYASADLYVIASRVELQSLSTMEAMASGLPVVAVNAGALPELVISGENGFLVPPCDGRAFGEAITNVLSNVGQRLVMGQRSREIAEMHSLGEMVTQYEQILMEASVTVGSRVLHGVAAG